MPEPSSRPAPTDRQLLIAAGSATYAVLPLLLVAPVWLGSASERLVALLVWLAWGHLLAFVVIDAMRSSRRAAALAVSLMGMLGAVSMLVALGAWHAGVRLTLSALRMILARWDDVWVAVHSEVTVWSWLALLAGPAALFAVVAALAYPLRHRVAAATRAVTRPVAAAVSVGLVAMAALTGYGAEGVFLLDLLHARLTDNRFEHAAAEHPRQQDFVGEVAAPSNVVFVVLESTRATAVGPDVTPMLDSLASRGLFAPSARATIPHTSKALVSIHCGIYPIRNMSILETERLRGRCLPAALRDAGFDTMFVQSAIGIFERRPEMTMALGFDRFLAAEGREPRPEPTGYLASDDVAMFDEAIAQLDDLQEPFFLTLLTSQTHHPYEPSATQIAKDPGVEDLSDVERYQLHVSRADGQLGRLLRALEARGLDERTLIVVVGDHGEAFERGSPMQHDGVYSQDGLAVPLVIAGPGVSPSVRTDLTSLVDIAPTVARLLGLAPHDVEGVDLLGDVDPDRRVFSGSWADEDWNAVHEGHVKHVSFREGSHVVTYDVSGGDDVRVPATDATRARADEADEWARRHLVNEPELVASDAPPRVLYENTRTTWECLPPPGGCTPRR